MFDPVGGATSEYPDHVEARLLELRLFFGQILFGDGADGGLLAFGDGFERVAESLAAAEFHLHENQGIFVA